jgi:maleate cis-trans isomerase
LADVHFRAVDEVMTCEPDYLIMGMSSETFWDGLEGSRKLHERVEARAGVKVSMGSDALQAALKQYGARRLSGANIMNRLAVPLRSYS